MKGGGALQHLQQSFTKPLYYRPTASFTFKSVRRAPLLSQFCCELLKKMFIFICLISCWLAGVFGDEVKSVSVMEGDSVTLNPDLTEIQRNDLIMWTFELALIAKTNGKDNKREFYDERFRDRLKLDQTGSLIITNTRTTDSGLYKVTSSRRLKPLNTFNLTVYACLSVPLISSTSSENPPSSSSSSSSQQNCSFLCSVVNVSDVSLSWYKGNSLLSSISVSDLSRSLSLHLECLDDFYSCVVNNPITNQTTHLNTQLCHTCSDVSRIALISAPGSLLIIAAVGIFFICRKHRKTDQEAETVDSGAEISYADPIFYKCTEIG
ncbi:hepatocyte cell adhesion molecule isoform X3 [Carassius gibelio]|uniref:hepatocyte cell adhesion molecule isoform X2 n=1 Tax=Carassius gibelio TaxID=101364 RepID=UPI002277BB96|nr:hepatocyte cell adhesion molecule isoform X2 [Carassius gibelio]XP_052447233.1 hepatocyte cell adhesion molecule isoform X3 [Carassius gibelio]